MTKMTDAEVEYYFENYAGLGKSYFDSNWQQTSIPARKIYDAYLNRNGRAPKRILDLGAANGAWLAEMSECGRFDALEGLELYDLPIANAVPGIEITQGDFNDTKTVRRLAKTGGYDIILISATFFIAEPYKFFRHLHTIINDGAIVACTFDPLIQGRLRVSTDGAITAATESWKLLHGQTVTPAVIPMMAWQHIFRETGWSPLLDGIDPDAYFLVERPALQRQEVRFRFCGTPDTLEQFVGPDVMPMAPVGEFWNPVMFDNTVSGYSYLVYQTAADSDFWVLDLTEVEWALEDIEAVVQWIATNLLGTPLIQVIGYDGDVLPIGLWPNADDPKILEIH